MGSKRCQMEESHQKLYCNFHFLDQAMIIEHQLNQYNMKTVINQHKKKCNPDLQVVTTPAIERRGSFGRSSKFLMCTGASLVARTP